MPTITVSKKELLAQVGKKLTDAQLKERISMLGTDLEGIAGDEISVEIFPNRPDLLSLPGLARALRAFIGKQTGLVKYPVKASGESVLIDKSVLECRPYTSCAIVRGLTITEEKLKEIIQIQEKLHITFGRGRKRAAIGIYPLEHISFPIHFKGLKPRDIRFQPLEMRREMDGEEILELHPKGKEFAQLLEGLKRYACFLDGDNRVMSLTPIINSQHTGKISERTTEVFVECSGFDQRILDECLAIIVTALADMGGRVESLELKHPEGKHITPNLEPTRFAFNLDYCNKLLGLTLTEKEAVALLGKMGFGYEKKHVLVPAYRTDIMHQADLAEDLAIAYGYDKIPETIPAVATVANANPQNELCERLREILVGHGLLEVQNYNLIGQEAQANTGMRARPVTVQHSLSTEYNTLRASLLPSLLETFARNRKHDYPQRLFELGKVFLRDPKSATGVREELRLAVALCGEHEDYTAIRQVLDSLFRAVGKTVTYKAAEHPSFLAGRAARAGTAVLGEIAPVVLERFGLEMPVATFELPVTALEK